MPWRAQRAEGELHAPANPAQAVLTCNEVRPPILLVLAALFGRGRLGALTLWAQHCAGGGSVSPFRKRAPSA
jgi:hypothetical protein